MESHYQAGPITSRFLFGIPILMSTPQNSFQPSPGRFDNERDHRQVHSSSKSNSKEMSDDQKSQVYEITLLRSEAKRLIAENRELKR